MKSLLGESQSYIDRINQLTPQSQAQWGKMDVSQMLVHCQKGMQATLGEFSMGKRALIGYIFGSYAKKQIFSEKPFPKNVSTFPTLKITEAQDFQKEKDNLIALIRKFEAAGLQGMTKEAHPFFGKLTPEETVHLQSKHLDHHLQQFSV